MTPIGFPGAERPLAIGGPPVVLADYTDEKGWVLLATAIFRSPYAVVTYTMDSFQATESPFILNLMGHTLPASADVWCSCYNPATPLGPMYGVQFSPSCAMPYERRVRVELSLPAGVPVAATTIWLAYIGRILINDERTFLRSVKRFMLEQMTGVRMDRYP